jgi:hypothetical protein
MNGRRVTKWSLLIIAVLTLTLGLARLFSGPEDTWIKDEHGKWVAHGNPSGPPSAMAYQPTWPDRVLPWAILAVAGAGLAGGFLISRRGPSTRESLTRDVRFFGVVSAVATVLALVIVIALFVTIVGSAETGMARNWKETEDQTYTAAVVFLLGMFGFSGFLALVGLLAHCVRKVLEAHYDLKRTAQLLQEAVEQLAAGANKGGPSSG